MTVYLGTAGILLVLLFIQKENKVWYWLISILLMVLSAIRTESVGWDIGNYIKEYNQHVGGSWKNAICNTEYSFSVYCKILGSFGLEERGFLAATAVLFALLVVLAIKINNCKSILALYLYYTTGLYIQSFCIIRQSLAISIALIALALLEKAMDRGKIPWGYFIGIFIAAGFHPTSLILMIFPLMMWFYSKKKRIKPVGFLRDGILFMLLILIVFSWLYPIVLQHTTSKYALLYGDGYVKGTFGNWKNGLLLMLLYFVFYLAFQNNWKQLSYMEYITVGTTITLAFTLVSLSMASSTLGRMNLFVEGLMILMLDKLLKKRYKRYTSVNFYIVLFFFVYFILYLMRDSIGVVSYRSMW